jgi:hypothetical protein
VLDLGVVEAYGQVAPPLAGGHDEASPETLEGHVPQPRGVPPVLDARVDADDDRQGPGAQQVERLGPARGVLGEEQPGAHAAADRHHLVAPGHVGDPGHGAQRRRRVRTRGNRAGDGHRRVGAVRPPREDEAHLQAPAVGEDERVAVEPQVGLGAAEVARGARPPVLRRWSPDDARPALRARGGVEPPALSGAHPRDAHRGARRPRHQRVVDVGHHVGGR